MLIKLYGPEPEKENRYSPARCIGTKTEIIDGNPHASHISTSYAERRNLTMRRSLRWFTRLTNGIPNKVENLAEAVSLYFI